MAGERWDLCLATFAATHRGGQKLWDGSGLRGARTPDDDAWTFEALRGLYRACDEAVGALAAAAGEDARLLVFSLHGMAANTARHELLPALLEAVLTGRAPAAAEARPGLQPLRRQLPWRGATTFKRRLPQAWQDRLTRFWRAAPGRVGGRPAFALLSDQQGYVRSTCRVASVRAAWRPGPSASAWWRGSSRASATFRDADRGALVAATAQSAEVYPDGPRRDLLPDLLVRWSVPRCRHPSCARLVSDRRGGLH